MNNGDRSETRPYPTGELIPFAPDSVVTPEDYRINLERIRQVKAALAFYEEQNNQGLQRFYSERQALEAAIEQGRTAAQRLAQMSGQPATDFFPAASVPVAGLSNAPQVQFLPQYQPPAPVYHPVELPTSARIDEVHSPHLDRPSSNAQSTHRANYYDAQARQNPAIHSGSSHARQSANVRPMSTDGGADQSTERGGAFTAWNSTATPAAHLNRATQWAQDAQARMSGSAAHSQQPQQQFMPRQTQPSRSASHTVRPAPQQALPPQQTFGAGPSGQTHDSQANQASKQPRYGPSTASSLDGALGASSSSVSESVPHAKVTYSSRHTGRPSQNSPQPPQAQAQPPPAQPPAIDPRDEQQLFDFFKRMSPATVQQLMVHVLTAVERKQRGETVRTAAEEEAGKPLNESMHRITEVISDRMKKHSIVELKRLFIKFFTILKIGREQAQTYSANISNALPDQHPVASQSVPAPHPRPVPVVPPPPPRPAQFQPRHFASSVKPVRSSSSAAPAPARASATSSAPSTSATHPSSSSSAPYQEPTQPAVPQALASAAQATPQHGWFVPREPNGPIAYRDGNGYIRFMYPPTGSVQGASSSAAAVPSFVHNPNGVAADAQRRSTPATEVESPGTPEEVEIPPASPWTPEKADRTRLARDIMRSLGRPKGSFGDPLLTTPSSPVVDKENQNEKDGKRKPPPASRPSTPPKRQRTEEPDATDVDVDASLPQAEVIDLTSSTSGDTVGESMRTTPDPEPEPKLVNTAAVEPAKEPSPPPEPKTSDATVEVPPMGRQASTVSSDAADVDRVQAMFAEPVVPESVASGPPSSTKSSSPPQDPLGVMDLPSVDDRLFAVDASDPVDAAAAGSVPPQDASDPERTISLSPGRDKVPLFLPSPSDSPVASGSSPGRPQPQSTPPQEEGVLSDGEFAPRPLYGHKSYKGKGKARQLSVDIDLTTPPGSPPPRRSAPRGYEVYVEVPPLPQYARRMKRARSTSPSESATPSGADESVNELVEWHAEEDRKTHEEEMREAAQLSFDRIRWCPCQWHGCGAVLNSMSTLQKHAALHASDNGEWGTYACRWQHCSHRFSDEKKLAQHVRKHAMAPLHCAYEGCDMSFNTAEALLAHHKSKRHRDGVLRRSYMPTVPADHRQELSPLPENVPAYMSVPLRVSRHPISKERHQWLGPKVLENITAFKYNGGRSKAGEAARGSRRLAEKVAAAELAGITPEAALAQIKRWIEEEYLAFADGYDGSRESDLRVADIPSQEVNKIIESGLVFWGPEDDQTAQGQEQEHVQERGNEETSGGPEGREGQDAGGRSVDDADEDARTEEDVEDPRRALAEAQAPATVIDGDGAAGASGAATALAADAGDSGDVEESRVDQLMEDVSDGGEGRTAPEADGGVAGGGRRLELPRRSKASVAVGVGGHETGAGGRADAEPPDPDQFKRDDDEHDAPPDRGPGDGGVGGGGALQQLDAEEQAVEIESPWPVWPPGRPLMPSPAAPVAHTLPNAAPDPAVIGATQPAMQSLPSPGYISARSAEVILSDVRPIKLKLEALQSINVLLDEFLYSILSVSRSLATDKLKAALLKVLPTSLGKEALLEAEVELKAYWERTTSARSPSSARNADNSQFDLQWSFELLRLKCEAYSTMNDSDEDAEAEKRLQQRMEAAGSSSPPNPSLLAPAALYLTAILEAICEHVLSNVSRVAARDSGRTLATIQDLFTALCEDEALYTTVKSMKAYEQIESLSKAQRPRRSKSFSRSTDKAMPRTSTSSPTPSKARMSTDSMKSNAPTVVGSPESRRTSMEKAKAVKIFHSRSLSDRERHEPAVAGALARSQSEIGINRDAAAEFEEDEELQQEFDELMRSGATMKVSLTPDRLKSMEVYKQERTERERVSRRAAGQGNPSEKVPDGGAAATGEPQPRRGASGRPTLRHVDSIVEDDEETGSSNHVSVSAPALQSNAASASARMRNTSFTASPSPTMARANDQRLRSISISNHLPQNFHQAVRQDRLAEYDGSAVGWAEADEKDGTEQGVFGSGRCDERLGRRERWCRRRR
ncbi:hypothetical protein BV20DRAFT_1112549 [Pilatotrama ljubarskyi]|nr:hypothetical protein BV20DRAFT_1112549 [Pilatotrama ljubarskyi]